MSGRPVAMNMRFQRAYAAPYARLKTLFADWIFPFTTSLLYCEDSGHIDEDPRNLYRNSMAPSCHIALLGKPTSVRKFHSLLLGIQRKFRFMLTDKANPLRMCRSCTNVFPACRSNAQFCCTACKGRCRAMKERK